MSQTCQRCGTDLTLNDNASAQYCYHCGLPQLTISAYTTHANDATVDPPAGAEHTHSRSISGVHWRPAIRSAAIVACVGALLNLLAVRLVALSLIGFMWLLMASILTIAFYLRGHRTWRMDTRVGLRLGVTVGILQSVLLVALLAGSGFVLRYHLHAMGSFDALMTQSLEDAIAKMGNTPQLPPEIIGLYRSPEMRAAAMMVTAAILSIGLTLFCAVTGIVGGLLFASRRASRAA